MNSEFLGVLLIPFSYLLITLIIAILKGMADKKEYFSRWHDAPIKNPLVLRMKTWCTGALFLSIVLTTAIFSESVDEIASNIFHSLPGILRPIISVTVMFGSFVVGFIFCCGIFGCVSACEKDPNGW